MVACKPLVFAELTSENRHDSFCAMSDPFQSIRMHASLNGHHLSGAERLLPGSESVEDVAVDMLHRALRHTRGRADQVRLTVESIADEDVVRGRLLDLSFFSVGDYRQGRDLAVDLLMKCGIAESAATTALILMADGAAGHRINMRGAMLIDADSGKRYEPDQQRGVRVSRMDMSKEVLSALRQRLALIGLDNSHVCEALVLASKVATCGVVAELCWSDDPDYLAGYVASSVYGYQRIDLMKPAGDLQGGRAFFIRNRCDDVQPLIDALQGTPFLATTLGSVPASF
ncbi:MAG: 6-carboxyhexanoate--CoA ligase [Desulfuromonas sp.]|nr:MAG: 6-carboxyhexanoate--CoA ligase [Desulfuromonas sp.]